MWTYWVERVVPGELVAVRAAIAALVDAAWGDRSRTILDTANERIDAIATDAGSHDPDVWLTWRTDGHPSGTRVELRLNELARGPDPHADLGTLLEVLSQRLA